MIMIIIRVNSYEIALLSMYISIYIFDNYGSRHRYDFGASPGQDKTEMSFQTKRVDVLLVSLMASQEYIHPMRKKRCTSSLFELSPLLSTTKSHTKNYDSNFSNGY